MNGGRIRFLAAIATVTATAVVVGAVSVPTASAFVNAPYADPAFETQLQALLDGASPPTVMDSSSAAVVDDAAAAAGRLGTSGIPALALGLVAFDVGWKIGRSIDTKFLHLSDPDCLIFGCNYSAATMGTTFATLMNSGPNSLPLYWTDSPVAIGSWTKGMYWNFCEATSSGGTTYSYGGNNYTCTAFPDYSTGGTPNAPIAKGDTAWNTAVADGWIPYQQSSAGGDCGHPTAVACWGLYRYGFGGLAASPMQTYTNQSYTYATTSTVPGTPTSSQLTAARGVIAADSHAAGWVNCELDPSGYVCPSRGGTDSGTTASPPGAVVTGPLDLPEPLPDEQYADYAERLRQLGWDRAIVPVPDPSFGDGTYPAGSPVRELAPGVVTGVAVAAGATSAYAPSGVRTAWPLSPPQGLATDTEIDVRVVPDGTGAVPPPVTPGTSIHFPAISSPCDKFPFGVLCWAGSIIGAFNAAPVAPGIDWHIPTVTTSVGDPITGRPEYNVTLSYFDSYMTTIRSLISWVLWIGAVWYVGSRLIGLKTGGDPTDAIDGAYDSLID